MKVMVVGGRGFLGSRVVTALSAVPGVEVRAASRRGGGGSERLDLGVLESFDSLAGYDCVVDCADSTAAAPDELVSHALEQGLLVVETTFETSTLVRLFEEQRERPMPGRKPPAGWLLLGMGLLPGLGALLAAAALERAERPVALLTAVRATSLSGAGPGTCSVMAEMLSQPALRYHDRRLVLDPPVAPGRRMPFPGERRRTVQVGLPEAAMLHWSRQVPTTASYLAGGRLALVPLVRLAGWLLSRRGAVSRLVRRAARFELRLIRARLLATRPTPVDLVAVAPSAADLDQGLSLSLSDGSWAAAWAVAAGVDLLRGRELAPGCHLPDEVLTLDEVVGRMRQLAGDRLEIAGPRSLG